MDTSLTVHDRLHVTLSVKGTNHALFSQRRDKVDLVVIMDRGSSVRKLAVAADRVVDAVIIVGKKLYHAVLHRIQLVILIKAVFFHVGTEEGYFSLEDARVIDAHILLLYKSL